MYTDTELTDSFSAIYHSLSLHTSYETDLFCAKEGDGVAGVPLTVVSLYLKCFTETVDGFGKRRPRKLKIGPGLFSVHLWKEPC